MKRLTIKRTFGIRWTEKPIKAKQKHFDDGEKEDVCVVANGISNTSERARQKYNSRSGLHYVSTQNAVTNGTSTSIFSGLLHYSSPQ